MQEKWVFKSESLKSAYNMKNALNCVFKEKKNEIEIFLSLYTKLDGALAEDIQLMDPIVFPEKRKGTIFLSFNKIFFNACLNINEQEHEKIELAYEFNPEKGHLILLGPEIHERDPDEL